MELSFCPTIFLSVGLEDSADGQLVTYTEKTLNKRYSGVDKVACNFFTLFQSLYRQLQTYLLTLVFSKYARIISFSGAIAMQLESASYHSTDEFMLV